MYPKNVYQVRETLFDKLNSFSIPYTDNQKLFKKQAIFDIESIYMEDEKFKDTETTTWSGNNILIWVSASSNLMQKPIFFCIPKLCDLASSFIYGPEKLAKQSKAEVKMNFLYIETALKRDFHLS